MRPDYRYVGRFIREKADDGPVPPVLCLTATTRPDVVGDDRNSAALSGASAAFKRRCEADHAGAATQLLDNDRDATRCAPSDASRNTLASRAANAGKSSSASCASHRTYPEHRLQAFHAREFPVAMRNSSDKRLFRRDKKYILCLI